MQYIEQEGSVDCNLIGFPHAGSHTTLPPHGRLHYRPVSYTHLRAHETPEHLVCRFLLEKKIIVFFLMIRRPPKSTLDRSSAASDVYKRQGFPHAGSHTTLPPHARLHYR